MKISAQMLRDKGACADQVATFVELFGEGGGNVTLARCRRAAKAGLSFDWATGLLSSEARANYGRALAPARAGYSRTLYKRAVAEAFYVAWQQDHGKVAK